MRKTVLVIAILVLAGAVTAQPSSITTTFISNNTGGAGWVVMFDVTIINPLGLKITSLDVNIPTLSIPFTIDVYTTPTTYVGKDGTPSAWTKVSTGNGVGVGKDKPTPVDVSDFVLKPGSYGVGIHYIGSGMHYTNGNGPNQKYANADVALQLGLARGGFFTGSVFSPRVWNGTIHYSPAITTNLTGSGTGGIGTTVNFTLTAAADAGLPYQMGSSFGNGPIPIDTRKLELSADTLLFLSVGGLLPTVFKNYAGKLDNTGAAKASLDIPNLPILKGIRIYTAYVTLLSTAPSGVSGVSNSFLVTIG